MKVTTGHHYLAFVLDEATKSELLKRFPPRFDVVRCDHITIAHGFEEKDVETLQAFVDANPSFETVNFFVCEGIDLFEVMSTGPGWKYGRPLGGYFHVTHSRTEDRRSSDSNKVLEGFINVDIKVVCNIKLSGEFKLIPIE